MKSKKRKRPKIRTPKQQPRAEITRAKILKSALREFAQLGLRGARVDVIATGAGINKQALYYHFGNKEALYRATLASVYDIPFPAHVTSTNEKSASPASEMRE